MIIYANSALIQCKDRDYKRKGKKREEHLEIKTDEISHCLKAQSMHKMCVVIEEVDK